MTASVRVDISPWIPGAVLIGDPGFGVEAENIPSSGVHGASFLYSSLEFPADNGKEICGRITRFPSTGLLVAEEDGSFEFSGTTGDSFDWQMYVDGVQVGSTQTVTLSFTGGSFSFAATNANDNAAISFYTQPVFQFSAANQDDTASLSFESPVIASFVTANSNDVCSLSFTGQTSQASSKRVILPSGITTRTIVPTL